MYEIYIFIVFSLYLMVVGGWATAIADKYPVSAKIFTLSRMMLVGAGSIFSSCLAYLFCAKTCGIFRIDEDDNPTPNVLLVAIMLMFILCAVISTWLITIMNTHQEIEGGTLRVMLITTPVISATSVLTILILMYWNAGSQARLKAKVQKWSKENEIELQKKKAVVLASQQREVQARQQVQVVKNLEAAKGVIEAADKSAKQLEEEQLEQYRFSKLSDKEKAKVLAERAEKVESKRPEEKGLWGAPRGYDTSNPALVKSQTELARQQATVEELKRQEAKFREETTRYLTERTRAPPVQSQQGYTGRAGGVNWNIPPTRNDRTQTDALLTRNDRTQTDAPPIRTDGTAQTEGVQHTRDTSTEAGLGKIQPYDLDAVTNRYDLAKRKAREASLSRDASRSRELEETPPTRRSMMDLTGPMSSPEGDDEGGEAGYPASPINIPVRAPAKSPEETLAGPPRVPVKARGAYRSPSANLDSDRVPPARRGGAPANKRGVPPADRRNGATVFNVPAQFRENANGPPVQQGGLVVQTSSHGRSQSGGLPRATMNRRQSDGSTGP